MNRINIIAVIVFVNKKNGDVTEVRYVCVNRDDAMSIARAIKPKGYKLESVTLVYSLSLI